MNLLDRSVVEMNVVESGEKLIAIPGALPALVLDRDAELGYPNEFVARETVVSKLIEASDNLPKGLCLSVKETYRPLNIQERLFQRRITWLESLPENTGLSLTEIREKAAQFVAPSHVAGHPTGGAVDVSLVDELGVELDMGCQYDDDEKASDGRCFSYCSELSITVIRNRKMLFESMESVGFINYPYEWWHWSYGDKYWAAVTGEPFAKYSVSISR